jgi:hypothetical protein
LVERGAAPTRFHPAIDVGSSGATSVSIPTREEESEAKSTDIIISQSTYYSRVL